MRPDGQRQARARRVTPPGQGVSGLGTQYSRRPARGSQNATVPTSLGRHDRDTESDWRSGDSHSLPPVGCSDCESVAAGLQSLERNIQDLEKSVKNGLRTSAQHAKQVDRRLEGLERTVEQNATTMDSLKGSMDSLNRLIESTVAQVGLQVEKLLETAHIPAQQTAGAVSDAGSMNMGAGAHAGYAEYPVSNMAGMPTMTPTTMMPMMPMLPSMVNCDGTGTMWPGGREVPASGVNNQEGSYTPN